MFLKSKLLSNLKYLMLRSFFNIPFYYVSSIKIKKQKTFVDRKHLFKPSLKASFSVEGAVVLPVVVCFCVFVMIFFRILAIQWGIHVGSIDIARKMAITGDISENQEDNITNEAGTAVLIGAVMAGTVSNKVPSKFIIGDNLGINLTESEVSERDIDIRCSYTVNAPTNMFGLKLFKMNQRVKVRRWVGYDPHEEDEDGIFVFVTEHGVAYHSTANCVYLNPSISTITPDRIASARNTSGGKYYKCESCGGNASVYYITDYGNRYHTSVTCKTFSRSIRQKRKEEAIREGYHPCSKCG